MEAHWIFVEEKTNAIWKILWLTQIYWKQCKVWYELSSKGISIYAPRARCAYTAHKSHTNHKHSAHFCSIREFSVKCLGLNSAPAFQSSVQTNLLRYGLRCVFVMIGRDNDTEAVSCCCCSFRRCAQHRRNGIRYPVERDNRQKQSHSQPFTYDSIHDACTS